MTARASRWRRTGSSIRSRCSTRQFENADRDFIIHWARTRLDQLQGLVKNTIPKTDDELYEHYRHRRWLPLYVTSEMDEKAARDIESKLTSGLVLTPIYSRFYPHGELAAHIIGYTGSVGKLPTGPINFNEPMWEESEGRAGLEKLFDPQLTGEPGMKKLLFDENGNKLLEEQSQAPSTGRHAGHHAQPQVAAACREDAPQRLSSRRLRRHRRHYRRGACHGLAAVVRPEPFHPRHQRDRIQGAQ